MPGDGGTQGRAIFISYRRDDSEGESGRLFDDLVRAYGDASVFMDVAGIQPGLDFRQAIDENVATCGVLLAVIGPTWTSVTDSAGKRRLENPDDYVRLEIASALARKIPVIPVLVHDAHMPPLDQLPDNLKDLRYRNSVELTHARWNSDVGLLIGALKSYVTVDTKHETEPVHVTIPAQLEAPGPVPAKAEKKSKLGLYAGIGAVAAIVAGAILLAVLYKRPTVPAPVLAGVVVNRDSESPVWQTVSSPVTGTVYGTNLAGSTLAISNITVGGAEATVGDYLDRGSILVGTSADTSLSFSLKLVKPIPTGSILSFVVADNGATSSPVNYTVPAPSAASRPAAGGQPPAPGPAVNSQPAPAPGRSGDSGGEAAILGTWKVSGEPGGADDLVQIAVGDSGSGVVVEAWGKCPGQPCAWGSRKAGFDGAVWETKSFELRNTAKEAEDQRSAKIAFAPLADGLQVTVKNTFHAANGATREKDNPLHFVRAR